jgi:pimeloyl-ACP methyl ester carboxylesterase
VSIERGEDRASHSKMISCFAVYMLPHSSLRTSAEAWRLAASSSPVNMCTHRQSCASAAADAADSRPPSAGRTALHAVVCNIRGFFSSGSFAPSDVADPDSLFADVDGVVVHYKRAGSDSLTARETVVCSHGFGANTSSFEAFVPHLMSLRSNARAAVLSFDSPGFGLTSRPPLRRLYQYYPRFATRIIPILAPHTARNVLIGHSLGSLGVIASVLASAEKDRVLPRALVLIAPAVVAGGMGRTFQNSRLYRVLRAGPSLLLLLVSVVLGPILNIILRIVVGGRASFWQRGLSLARANPESLTQCQLDGYRRPLKVRGWANGFVNFVRAMILDGTAQQKEDVVARLAALRPRLPILIIHGAKDRLIPLSNSRQMEIALRAHCKLIVMPGAGHVPHEEMPAEFAQHVASFLDSVPGQP